VLHLTRLTEHIPEKIVQAKATHTGIIFCHILSNAFIEFGNVQGIITYKKKLKELKKARNVKEHTSQTRTTSEI
jgi:hypothetical protein